ncbi:hypothetical protein [Alteribacillus sp. HJP-4]|uniref:hypothetical protein n=1 Tax=Alteribacillus sp. HJP-4 TaxID=2775394 RepID=UPI0035CCCC89
MKKRMEMDQFVYTFWEKFSKAEGSLQLSEVRDYVYTYAPVLSGNVPFIEMMSLIWEKDADILREAAKTEPMSFELLVEILENASEQDFKYMKHQLMNMAPLASV